MKVFRSTVLSRGGVVEECGKLIVASCGVGEAVGALRGLEEVEIVAAEKGRYLCLASTPISTV
jgi:hypothetical protein